MTDQIAPPAGKSAAWLHVDGAFGLWAATVPSLRKLLAGCERADSWATDAHKWLHVPYDSGLARTAHPAAHRAALPASAAHLMMSDSEERNSFEWVPESPRRARAFPIYVALRTLGRAGVTGLIDRCCALARRLAQALRGVPGVRVLNDVVINQVLVRFGDSDATTKAVWVRVQESGVCWLGGTQWHGQTAMRVPVSGWSTTAGDIDRSASTRPGPPGSTPSPAPGRPRPPAICGSRSSIMQPR